MVTNADDAVSTVVTLVLMLVHVRCDSLYLIAVHCLDMYRWHRFHIFNLKLNLVQIY